MCFEIRLESLRVQSPGLIRVLGKRFARALVKVSALVATSDVSHERRKASSVELAMSYVPMDLLEPQATNEGLAAAAVAQGGLDGLINNVAITNSSEKDMGDITVGNWDSVTDVKVRGTGLLTAAARPFLVARASVSVVNQASDTGHRGDRCNCHLGRPHAGGCQRIRAAGTPRLIRPGRAQMPEDSTRTRFSTSPISCCPSTAAL